MSKRTKTLLTWSTIISACIALYWTVWYIQFGTIPYISSISLAGKEWVSLPFELPRWWDVLAGPMVTFTLMAMVRSGSDLRSPDQKGYSGVDETLFCAFAVSACAHLAFVCGFYNNGILGGIIFGGAFEIAGLLLILIFAILRSGGSGGYDDF